MEDTTKYKDELTGEVREYQDWIGWGRIQDAHISKLSLDNDERLMIRKNITNELLADLICIEHKTGI